MEPTVPAMITVYQFKRYDITTDTLRLSRRWGTREGIAALGGSFQILEETATEVAEADVQSDIPGLTAIGFNPLVHKGP